MNKALILAIALVVLSLLGVHFSKQVQLPQRNNSNQDCIIKGRFYEEIDNQLQRLANISSCQNVMIVEEAWWDAGAIKLGWLQRLGDSFKKMKNMRSLVWKANHGLVDNTKWNPVVNGLNSVITLKTVTMQIVNGHQIQSNNWTTKLRKDIQLRIQRVSNQNLREK